MNSDQLTEIFKTFERKLVERINNATIVCVDEFIARDTEPPIDFMGMVMARWFVHWSITFGADYKKAIEQAEIDVPKMHADAAVRKMRVAVDKIVKGEAGIDREIDQRVTEALQETREGYENTPPQFAPQKTTLPADEVNAYAERAYVILHEHVLAGVREVAGLRPDSSVLGEVVLDALNASAMTVCHVLGLDRAAALASFTSVFDDDHAHEEDNETQGAAAE